VCIIPACKPIDFQYGYLEFERTSLGFARLHFCNCITRKSRKIVQLFTIQVLENKPSDYYNMQCHVPHSVKRTTFLLPSQKIRFKEQLLFWSRKNFVVYLIFPSLFSILPLLFSFTTFYLSLLILSFFLLSLVTQVYFELSRKMPPLLKRDDHCTKFVIANKNRKVY
jgi:hypothetical protein